MTDEQFCGRLREILPLAQGMTPEEIMDNQVRIMIEAQKNWKETEFLLAEAMRQDPLVAWQNEMLKTPFQRWCDGARNWED
jgi:hypothetical protein